MRNILSLALAFSLVLTIASCGSSSKDEKSQIGDLKVKLEKLKQQKNGLETEIRQVEEQLAKADPNATKIAKLVAVDTLRISDFVHFIELQGKIDAENVAYVAPKGQGGQVRAIYVKQGDRVNKGQLILKLDDALARESVVGAQQQANAVKAQLELAKSVYQRQQNLWKQNIGTEVQVLNAKTNVDALQSQLNGAEASVKLAQEQMNQSNVYAEMSGVIDHLNIRVGEFFSPQTAADPRAGQIKIVNTSNTKMVTNVPENYVARVQKGDSVRIEVPETGKPAFRSIINVVGASIDPTTRSFTAEAKLPSDPFLKPNQLATMRILDYRAKGVVTAPVNMVQTDEKGKYVFVIEKSGDKWIAKKKVVTVGESYGGVTEIKSGLTGGELIITEGYQNVYDGQAVTTK